MTSPHSSPPTNKQSSIFRKYLSEGFISLLKSPSPHNNTKTVPSLNSSLNSTTYNKDGKLMVTVSFVDTKNGTGISYFDSVENVIQREFSSTLRNVPYQNARSGVASAIDTLPIKCVRYGEVNDKGDTSNNGSNKGVNKPEYDRNSMTTSSHSDVSTNSSKIYTSKGGDAAEWHVGPYCHVYLAVCDGYDNYRNKVRPAIQAFISQLEGNASASGNSSGQYVLIYIPGGRGASTSDSESRRLSLARGFGAVRAVTQRGVGYESMGNDDNGVSGTGLEGIVLSNKEKELFRKMQVDFPNGRVCLLSSLAPMSNETGGTSGVSTSSQTEWSIVLKNISLAIVAGFRDRCKRYDDELRRLERSQIGSFDKKKDAVAIFLVKESLAFTYEQMQLYSEAQLQYKELSAFNTNIPFIVDENFNASSEAVSGDVLNFRLQLAQNAVNEFEFHYYIFARESHLLFLLRCPVEVLECAHSFIRTLYEMKKKSMKIEAEAWALTAAWDVKCAADCFFHFDKDHGMHQSSTTSSGLSHSVFKRFNLDKVTRNVGVTEQEKDASRKLSELLEFARLRLLKLGDLVYEDQNPVSLAIVDRPVDTFENWVEWEKINNGHKENDVDEHTSNGEVSSPSPWEEKDALAASDLAPPADLTAPIESEHPLSGEKNNLSMNEYRPFLTSFAQTNDNSTPKVFSSPDEYETKYLELSTAIISLYQLGGRYRFASRLLGEQAEIYILRKDISKAVNILSSIVDLCAKDQWDSLFLWRLFRLACCQRIYPDYAPSYLRTLIKCFTPKMNNIAPRQVLELFQRDLEVLVKQDSVHLMRCGRLDVSPFLESELFVVESSLVGVSSNAGNTNMTKSSHPLGYLRKKLVKYFCFVGEHISLGINLTSYLPNPIELDNVRLFLLTLEDYEDLYRRSTSAVITKSQAYRIIEVQKPNEKIDIQPGKNQFYFKWVPMAVGQFVLASVELQWAQASFFHDSATLRRPIQGVQILPSEPTQTLELNPLYLIPGFEQEIRLVFYSGQDIITGGTVEIVCSDGLTVIPPNEHDDAAWSKSCTITLEPCGPDTTLVMKTLVKSDPVEGYGRKGGGKVQTLHVKVVTNYHHNLYNSLTVDGQEPLAQPMATDLEALVTTLDRPALTVYRIEAYALSEQRVIVSVSLHCNTPTSFSLKEWDVHFPPPLVLDNEGDVNHGLFSHPVAEGEELFFAFTCKRDDSLPCESREKPILHVILQDEFKKTFRQVLTLDMDNFYEKVMLEEVFNVSNTATAVLTCSSDEGVVGAPVYFTFELDISMLGKAKDEKIKPKSLLYSISCDAKDWILSGRVRGVVDTLLPSPRRIDIIGIPTRSGLIKRFPEVELFFHEENPPISVRCRYPDSFRSLSYTNHMALAYPSVLESANH